MKLPNLTQYREMLAGHVLELHERGPTITAYYLKSPGHGRQFSTLVLFTPEAIVLLGDLTPQNHGTVSCRGYGVDWFVRASDPSYLAEKFLRERFIPELARERLRDRQWWTDCQGVDDPGKLDAIASLAADAEDLQAAGLHLRLSEIIGEYVEHDAIAGWGYDPNEVALLVAIRERFAHLYSSLPPTVGPTGGDK